MKITHLPDIELLISQLQQANESNLMEEVRRLAVILERQAMSVGDLSGLAAAQLYQGIGLYAQEDFCAAMTRFEKCLENARAVGDTYYEMKALNSLGATTSEQAEFFSSLNHYLACYHICQAHPEFHYAHIVLNNIGNLFVWLDEFETAKLYLERSYREYHEQEIDDFYIHINLIINLMEVYSYTGDYEQANLWRDNRAAGVDLTEMGVVICMDLANRADQAMQSGDRSDCRSLIVSFLEQARACDDFIYIFRSLLRVFQLSMDLEDEALAREVMVCTQEKGAGSSIYSFNYRFAELKMEYHRRFLREGHNSQDSFVDEYCTESRHMLGQYRDAFVHSLKVALELDQSRDEAALARQENEKLYRDIELDIFTGLYNKTSAIKYAGQALANRAPDQLQALVMLDIDKFKTINDCYGHHFGDKIIAATASLLQSLDHPHKLVGRFGGDEYMLFLNCLSDLARLHDLLRWLMARVKQLELPDTQVSHVTFSMGAYVITEDVGFESAFELADQLLYQAKNQGRDRAVIACKSQITII